MPGGGDHGPPRGARAGEPRAGRRRRLLVRRREPDRRGRAAEPVDDGWAGYVYFPEVLYKLIPDALDRFGSQLSPLEPQKRALLLAYVDAKICYALECYQQFEPDADMLAKAIEVREGGWLAPAEAAAAAADAREAARAKAAAAALAAEAEADVDARLGGAREPAAPRAPAKALEVPSGGYAPAELRARSRAERVEIAAQVGVRRRARARARAFARARASRLSLFLTPRARAVSPAAAARSS